MVTKVSKVIFIFLLCCTVGCNAQFGPTPTATPMKETATGDLVGDVIPLVELPKNVTWSDATSDPTVYPVGEHKCTVILYNPVTLEMNCDSGRDYQHRHIEHLPGDGENIWHAYFKPDTHPPFDARTSAVKMGFCCFDLVYFQYTNGIWKIGVP
jgi:hypothetical protein